MALLEVVTFPDDRLRRKCRPLTTVDDKIRTLASDMLETMYDDEGIGLAAPQVGLDIRLVVIDIPAEDGTQKHNPLVLINPEIIAREGEVASTEGCLSVPEYTAEVKRAEKVTVKALDQNGVEQTYNADGLFAICLQHEIDHLDGKLFIDYLSTLKRNMLRKRYSKLKKEQQRAAAAR
ncbi:MAG: peptide deformylase [Candidatus Anaerobiospirillum merdipullorum]|uniref:Peptide deformylase n=1 Tax=Candidatus Anaerobiospirillum merdipullorum TaxID=2838450 RepID=A0A9E2KMD4_9GAMM|nr:peptide deformylase [Candidatus Anaerobiospirillum merdipullorum]